jgi:hypothetical protein
VHALQELKEKEKINYIWDRERLTVTVYVQSFRQRWINCHVWRFGFSFNRRFQTKTFHSIRNLFRGPQSQLTGSDGHTLSLSLSWNPQPAATGRLSTHSHHNQWDPSSYNHHHHQPSRSRVQWAVIPLPTSVGFPQRPYTIRLLKNDSEWDSWTGKPGSSSSVTIRIPRYLVLYLIPPLCLNSSSNLNRQRSTSRSGTKQQTALSVVVI